jgi:hypothetical protein
VATESILTARKEKEDRMLNAGAKPHGVMEGKGSYNKHAKLPAGGAALAMPLLEKAVQSLELDPRERPRFLVHQCAAQSPEAVGI